MDGKPLYIKVVDLMRRKISIHYIYVFNGLL